MAGSYEPDGSATLVLGHNGLKVGGRLMLGFGLAGAPFHEQAVAQASEHPHDPNAFGTSDAATIIVVRHVQALVSAIFDSPGVAIKLEPFLGRELLWRGAGDQGDQFVFAALDLAQKQSRLLGQGKTDLFGRQRLGADGPALRPSFVDFLGPGLRGRWLQRGENRPRGP